MRTTRVLRCLRAPVVFKPCIDCKHFQYGYKTCKQFGETDVITGEHHSLLAKTCRYDESKCGLSAAHYQELGKKESEQKFSLFVLNQLKYPFLFSSLYFGAIIYFS